MYATIQRWGNSQGLRIPKAMLDAIGLRENDRVELTQEEDGIRIQKLPQARHRTLEERLPTFYGKPLEQIGPVTAGEVIALVESEELDWGSAEGTEVW